MWRDALPLYMEHAVGRVGRKTTKKGVKGRHSSAWPLERATTRTTMVAGRSGIGGTAS